MHVRCRQQYRSIYIQMAMKIAKEAGTVANVFDDLNRRDEVEFVYFRAASQRVSRSTFWKSMPQRDLAVSSRSMPWRSLYPASISRDSQAPVPQPVSSTLARPLGCG